MLSDAEKQDGDDNSNNEKVNEWCVVVCHMISNIQDKELVVLSLADIVTISKTKTASL
jgi:hypothetical protein